MSKEMVAEVEEFFRRRFPSKNLKFEKECGYFWEWYDRFASGHPESWMDEISLQCFKNMQEAKQKEVNAT